MIQQWMEQFKALVLEQFGDAVCFIGLQGSQARGEAAEDSDIDVVVILDQLSLKRMKAYRGLLAQMPYRDKICGFLSGREELKHWEAGDLFQFYYDTIPVYGSLDELVEFDAEKSARKAVHMGACGVYHGCVHNFIHERSPEVLASLCKKAVFVIQARVFCQTGVYIARHEELMQAVGANEQKIIKGCRLHKEYQWGERHLEEFSELLLDWSKSLIGGKV